jgi:hypothetical protein
VEIGLYSRSEKRVKALTIGLILTLVGGIGSWYTLSHVQDYGESWVYLVIVAGIGVFILFVKIEQYMTRTVRWIENH